MHQDKNYVFESAYEGELEKEVVVSKMEIITRHGAIDGKTQIQEVDLYNRVSRAYGMPEFGK